MSHKFDQIELQQVKRRWQIATLVLYVATIVALILIRDDSKAIIALLLTICDLLAVFLIITIIGRVF